MAANYFGRISKSRIIDASREMKGGVAPAWTGMRKSELAALAERQDKIEGEVSGPAKDGGTDSAKLSFQRVKES